MSIGGSGAGVYEFFRFAAELASGGSELQLGVLIDATLRSYQPSWDRMQAG
jgi:hypothetical protein